MTNLAEKIIESNCLLQADDVEMIEHIITFAKEHSTRDVLDSVVSALEIMADESEEKNIDSSSYSEEYKHFNFLKDVIVQVAFVSDTYGDLNSSRKRELAKSNLLVGIADIEA